MIHAKSIYPKSAIYILQSINSKSPESNTRAKFESPQDVNAYTVQTSYNLNGTCVCFCVKMQNACACVSPHVATVHAFHFVAILLLQTYGHYPSSTCFHILSVAHLSIPNCAENIRIIICVMHQESNA